MSYGLIYTVPFATLDNIPCVVEIEKDGYEGESTELIPGVTPFTIDINSEEFLYIPTRFSTAKLQIVGSDYLQSLFSTAYREYRVTLIKDGVITWCGFIKPELYTQDYTSEKFILEIECISAMSVLEFIDYTIEGDSKEFVSLWRLLQRCVSTAIGRYTSVYIPHVYASSKATYTTGENVLANMTLSEQDFFDEDDKPMKLKEVLEEVCKFLNWTCVDWKGSLYFVDVDHSGTYYKYNAMMTSKADAQINELLVQDIGFAGGNHSLDVLPGFNKVTVKCSNYSVGQMLQEEDFNDLEELSTIDNKTSDNKKACRSVYLYPDAWNCLLYRDGSVIDNSMLSSVKDIAPSLDGAMLMKYCVYEQEKDANGVWQPSIHDYSFINAIRVRFPLKGTPGVFNLINYKVLTFKGASATYMDCALGINATVKVIKDNDMLPWGNSAAGYARNSLRCQIRIGNEYYGNHFGDSFHGFTWAEDPMNFVILNLDSWNNDGKLEWLTLPNDKTLDMPYNGLSGLIVPIDRPISGELEFNLLVYNRQGDGSRGDMTGIIIKDFSVKIQNKDNISKSDNDSDRTYENVLNENYINELDEIEFKMSSYNEDGACYSKVLLDGDYLKDNLYNCILDDAIRPEEMMITRCINHYSATRIKLTQEIKEHADLSPITRLSDTFLVDKKFICTGGTIDCQMNKFECVMIEI
jgi:hypothetical protein|nr:MAG TPA_asm: hypothetical protein [Caudoviricetes sp.]